MDDAFILYRITIDIEIIEGLLDMYCGNVPEVKN